MAKKRVRRAKKVKVRKAQINSEVVNMLKDIKKASKKIKKDMDKLKGK